MAVEDLPKDPLRENKFGLGEQATWLYLARKELLVCSENYYKFPSDRNYQFLQYAARHQADQFRISLENIAHKKESPYSTEEEKVEIINLLADWEYLQITGGIRKIIGIEKFQPEITEEDEDDEGDDLGLHEEYDPTDHSEWLKFMCDYHKDLIDDEVANLIMHAQKTLGGRFLDVVAAAKYPPYAIFKVKKAGKVALKAFLEGFEKMASPPPV